MIAVEIKHHGIHVRTGSQLDRFKSIVCVQNVIAHLVEAPSAQTQNDAIGAVMNDGAAFFFVSRHSQDHLGRASNSAGKPVNCACSKRMLSVEIEDRLFRIAHSAQLSNQLIPFREQVAGVHTRSVSFRTVSFSIKSCLTR